MSQDQLVFVMQVMCLAGAGLGVLEGMLGYLVFKGFALLDARLNRLEERIAK